MLEQPNAAAPAPNPGTSCRRNPLLGPQPGFAEGAQVSYRRSSRVSIFDAAIIPDAPLRSPVRKFIKLFRSGPAQVGDGSRPKDSTQGLQPLNLSSRLFSKVF